MQVLIDFDCWKQEQSRMTENILGKTSSKNMKGINRT